MAETNTPQTSLARAYTPNIDRLLPTARVGQYWPILADHHAEPKTDIVIPYMYYVEPSEFVGRASLELIDSGANLNEGDWVASFRARIPTMQLIKYLEEIAALSGSRVQPSPFSAQKNLYTVIQDNQGKMTRAIAFITKYLSSKGIAISDLEVRQFCIPSVPSNFNLWFPGWSRGSLRGVFRLLGAEVNNFTPPLFDFQSYRNNLQFIISDNVIDKVTKNDVIVFFIKETDTASHLDKKDLKVEAIELLDWTFAQIQPYIPQDSLIVILTDHPTNLGAKSASYYPTPYLIAHWADFPLECQHHFCEDYAARMCNNQIINMNYLREIIYSQF